MFFHIMSTFLNNKYTIISLQVSLITHVFYTLHP